MKNHITQQNLPKWALHVLLCFWW